jgi:enoyl-CoA hydratase/carnithine racemase
VSVVVAIDGRVATCTLDRPERLNAIDLETYDGIVAFAAQLQADDDLWVGVITGAGDRAFSAGADLKKLLAQMEARGPGAAPPFVTAFAGIGLAKPLIAAVNGLAYGGGCELALSCDLRVLATGARLALPEPKRGLIPGWGGTQLLPRLVPRAIALELLLTGRDVGAEEALSLGLANRIAPNALAAAHELAAEICANAPTAVRHIRSAALRGAERSLADGLAVEAEMMAAQRATADSAEGVAAFLDKRAPDWPGR